MVERLGDPLDPSLPRFVPYTMLDPKMQAVAGGLAFSLLLPYDQMREQPMSGQILVQLPSGVTTAVSFSGSLGPEFSEKS